MPYNFVADGFHTKKCRLSSSEVRFYTENGRFAALNPLGLVGKSVRSGLLLMLGVIELFARC